LAKKNAAKRRRKIQLANCGVRESRAFGGSGLETNNLDVLRANMFAEKSADHIVKIHARRLSWTLSPW
jgi:hypothetical protein